MKYFSYISAFLFAATFALASCSQEEELTGDNNDSIQVLQLGISDAGYQDSDARAAYEAYKTTFVDGDAVGVFAVKGGVIVSNINNRRFTMTEGVWELNDEGGVIEYKGSEFKKMKFYAYYPYNANISIDPEIEGDPFANVVSKWMLGTDQSGDNFGKYDLMTSVGEAEGQRLQGKIEFTLQHRMGLAIIKMPFLTYSFTNGAIDDYKAPIKIGDFNINSATGQPRYDEATDTYMMLVKPESKFTIEGTYSGVKEMNYKVEGTAQKGLARQYTIKDESKLPYTLAVGDYFCADGKLVSKDAGEVPENCIGIVFYAGNPQPSVAPADVSYTEANDALRRDFPNCKHGLIVAVDYAENSGSKTSVFATVRTTAFGTWFKNDEDWKDKLVSNEAKNTIPLPGMLGYNNTVLIEKCPQRNVAANLAWDFIGDYRANVAKPRDVSNWFLPSVKEYEELAKVLSTINSGLRAVTGGDELIVGSRHWTSNERTGNVEIVYQHSLNVSGHMNDKRRNEGAGYFRLMLAF